MREIKFRAWDDSISKMISWEELLSVTVDGRSFFGLQSILKGEGYHYNLEQFTGLHDKNGKEIYEGDIVSFSGFDHRGVVQFARGVYGVNWEYAKNQNPEWKEGRLYGSWGHLHNLRHFADDLLNDTSVIGNIHENPKLLDSK